MNYKLLKGLFYIVLSLGIFTSCQRDEISLPTDESNTPVFYFSGDLDGQNTNVVAGVDEKFMHTDHDLDQFEITTFIGHMGEESCNEICEGSFRFALRDYDTTDKTDLSKGLPPASFSFRNNVEVDEGGDVYRVSFDSHFNEDNPSFLWFFDDETISRSVADPIHIYKEEDKFRVPYFRSFVNNDSELELAWKARQLPFVPNGFDEGKKVNAHINFEDLGSNRVRLSLDIQGEGWEAIPSISWSITRDPLNATDSEALPSTTDSFVEIVISEPTEVGVTLIFFDPNGAFNNPFVDVGAIIDFDANGKLTYTTVDFDYEVEEITNGARLALATFDLQYMDESGKFYSSALGEQTNDAYFDIKSIEDYQKNASGQNTKKLEVETSCRLYADDGESILLTNGEGVIAVAVPD